jgi:monovalent cation/hydrogen antiporter
MQQLETVLALLVVVSVLALAAQRLRVPYPVPLVLGGLALGFVPGLPRVQLSPDAVFTLFLPPLIFAAAQGSSPRDLRDNAGSIVSLALGLTLATIALVAVVAHLLIGGLGWQPAFVLGAVVAPTDPIAVSTIMHRLGIPRRTVALVEAESLINDAIGLVSYRVAVAAAVSGSFSLWSAGAQFVLVSVGGVAIGALVGLLVARIHERLDHTPVEITLTLLTPFAAYLAADAIGVSGILAVTVCGILLVQRSATILAPESRLQAAAVWEVVVFVLNGLLFVLVGLQMHAAVRDLPRAQAVSTLLYALGLCATVFAVRPVWLAGEALVERLWQGSRREARATDWRQRLVVSWSGMRGSAAIAAALALPLTVRSGAAFPDRSLLLLLTFAVILATLTVQGLTMPALIRQIGASAPADDAPERLARLRAAEAALARVEQFAAEEWIAEEAFTRVREVYRNRIDHLRESARPFAEEQPSDYESSYHFLREQAVAAEREAIRRLGADGVLHDDALRQLRRELDLEQERLKSWRA